MIGVFGERKVIRRPSGADGVLVVTRPVVVTTG
jgi:hypothetical protein